MSSDGGIGMTVNKAAKDTQSQDEHIAQGGRSWRSVWLIYRREMVDQLRDRRTLFTIAILPILLYPLLGMVLLQISQFKRESPISVCVLGRDHLDVPTPLFDGDGFAEGLDEGGGRIELVHYDWGTIKLGRDVREETTSWIQDGRFDVVLVIPPEFLDHSARTTQDVANLQLYYDVTSDESRVARGRIISLLNQWQSRWVRGELAETGIKESVLNPFRLDEVDVAPQQSKSAAFWSKMLPFIMLVWALTGAFYPAIDLVAGEKERGTLETLLCSPASRAEIVWGKLCAVTTASIATAVLNCCSMLVTSSLIFKQISLGSGAAVGSPPLVPMLWLLIALIPLSFLFSAVALAAAALAKSSKEGQYYLMPLMMVTLPLVLIPMLPGIELSAGTSLIPVTGMFLLVRSLVEGDYLVAALHVPMVLGVTSLCLWLAMNWAKRQFEDEAVLFGSQEPFDLRLWLTRAWEQRGAVPSRSVSYFCGAVILVALFFAKLSGGEMPEDGYGFAKMVLYPQLTFILAPSLAFALLCSRKPLLALKIRGVSLGTLAVSLSLGVLFHPTYLMLGELVSTLYPVSEQAVEAMKPIAEQISQLPWGLVIVLIAVTPAICEELAFRGLVFSGLERNGQHWGAIIITALLFGASHGVLQQSICATVMGLVLGWVAFRTGSVLPGMLFHFANNAMSASLERLANGALPGFELLFVKSESTLHYQTWWVVMSIGLSLLAFWFLGKSHRAEESNVDHGEVGSVISVVDNDRDRTDPLAITEG
ncbi:MAG: ABC transporter permease subunit/CPBP intramembrane protease [Rubripirellula sp.]